jgi:hypothetical protein
MATSTTPTLPKPPSQKLPTAMAAKGTSQPTPPTPANGTAQPKPPANESRIHHGVIERYAHGKLVSREAPKPAAKPKPAATSAPAAPQPPASIATPRDAQNSEHFIGKLGSEDIWSFKPINPKDTSKGVIVTHYQGYRVMSRNEHKTERADTLYHEMLAKGLVYIDGVKHKLVDEEA